VGVATIKKAWDPTSTCVHQGKGQLHRGATNYDEKLSSSARINASRLGKSSKQEEGYEK